jgi:hypothetical protein
METVVNLRKFYIFQSNRLYSRAVSKNMILFADSEWFSGPKKHIIGQNFPKFYYNIKKSEGQIAVTFPQEFL